VLGVLARLWKSETLATLFWGNSAANFYLTDNAYYRQWLASTASSNGAATYQMLTNSHIWSIAASGTAGDPITFTQAMTLDASGNLLVGKTTTAFGTQGIRLEGSNGKIEITRDNNVPFALNRLTSDGDLIHFYKAGAIMGVIGVANGDNLYIASDDTTDVGLKFDGDANAIYACTATGAIRDNAVILGDPAVRFKDLYLSGSVYLGGTTSANALDDYEEGVWTPVLNRTTLGTVTYTLQTGYYVKIGRVVYVWGKVTWSNISSVGSGNNYISGLPFSAGTGQANGWANFGGSSGVATNPVLAGLFYNQTVYLRKSANILADGNIGEDYNNSGTFGFNGMYNIL
jgi:hypothetical protein